MNQSPARIAGMLMHVTSLPSPDGVGDIGAASRNFVDFLSDAGQKVWQTLPLHPPANLVMSPYDACSAFAGNPLLIELEGLVELDLLPDNLEAIRRSVGAQGTDFAHPEKRMVAGERGGDDPLARTARWKLPLIRQAAKQLLSLEKNHPLAKEFMLYCQRESSWLADYVAFTMLREQYPNVPRSDWPLEVRVKRTGANRARTFDTPTHQHPEAATQFLFDKQFTALRQYAAASGVLIMGDMPIYVGEDSADVWANPELFMLDSEFRAAARTGAPPDAMDPTGQIWEMPPYNWQAHEATDYAWWMNRLRRELANSDILRIDHFRAFADWWCVPSHAAYSEQGKWMAGPGASFFDRVAREFGASLPLVAEDLGTDTKLLQELREQTDIPLMRVLAQGLDEGGASTHLPEAWTENIVAYTATHDYPNIYGWALEADEPKLNFALRYTGAKTPTELAIASIRRVLSSRAQYAIVQLQDWLSMDNRERMNVPGTRYGNWRWQIPAEIFTTELANLIRKETESADRA